MTVYIGERSRQSALEVAADIAKRLANPEWTAEIAWLACKQSYLSVGGQWNPISVADGYPAFAIFFGQMDRCFPGQQWDLIAHTYLELGARALETVPNFSSFPGLFGGLAGLCFAAYSLSCNGTRYQRLLSRLDDLLIQQTIATVHLPDPFIGGVGFTDYDLISGPAGIGAYLLLRRDISGAVSALNVILDQLLFLSRWKGYQFGFFIPAERQATKQHLEQYPNGSFDCGLAHGVCGPLAFLSLVRLCGIERPGLSDAIQRLASWVVNQHYNDDWGVNWPGAVSANSETKHPEVSRAAWCYGSPGVARALWLAGCVLQDADLQNMAIEAIKAVRRRPIEARNIPSPILCHGIAGLLQIVLRFAKDIGSPFLTEMVSELVQQLLSLFEPNSLVGFFDVRPDGKHIDNPGLLEGSTGAILALLAAATDAEPIWDRMFLLS